MNEGNEIKEEAMEIGSKIMRPRRTCGKYDAEVPVESKKKSTVKKSKKESTGKKNKREKRDEDAELESKTEEKRAKNDAEIESKKENGAEIESQKESTAEEKGADDAEKESKTESTGKRKRNARGKRAEKESKPEIESDKEGPARKKRADEAEKESTVEDDAEIESKKESTARGKRAVKGKRVRMEIESEKEEKKEEDNEKESKEREPAEVNAPPKKKMKKNIMKEKKVKMEKGEEMKGKEEDRIKMKNEGKEVNENEGEMKKRKVEKNEGKEVNENEGEMKKGKEEENEEKEVNENGEEMKGKEEENEEKKGKKENEVKMKRGKVEENGVEVRAKKNGTKKKKKEDPPIPRPTEYTILGNGPPPIPSTGRKYMGCHVSGAGGVWNAFKDANDCKAKSFGVFLRSQRRWDAKPLDDYTVEKWENAAKLFPAHLVLPHGSYLMNLGSTSKDTLEKSRNLLVEELKRCERLGIPHFNFHPGSTLGQQSRLDCCKLIAEGINLAHEETKGVICVLENMCGQGFTVGGDLHELRAIIEHVKDDSRIGVCLDTCHAHAAGYDLSTQAGFHNLLDDFGKIIGWQFLRALHINDSKGKAGDNLDRHECIGQGTIGLEGFRRIMNCPYFNDIPLILETPWTNNEGYAEEIRILEEMIKKK